MKHTFTVTLMSVLGLATNGACLGQTRTAAMRLVSHENSPAGTQQAVLIRGVVKGPKGPLPGAVITAKGTQSLTVSDASGKFELAVTTTAAVVELVCSYAGLADESVKVKTSESAATIQMMKRVPRTMAEPVLESGWW